jgi:hypothetical protein
VLSLPFFLFLGNFLLIFSLAAYDSYLLLLIVFPWTTLLFLGFTYKGFRFSDNDIILKYAGRLFWTGKGSFKATLIAVLNLLLLAIMIPSSVMEVFDLRFGPFTSMLILLILPIPGFLLFSIKKADQEKLYGLLYDQLYLESSDIPLFIVLTNELLIKYKQYTIEYFNQMELIRKECHAYLTEELPQLSPFIDIESSYSLNLDDLTLFLTKKTFKPDNTIGIKNTD